MYMGCVNYFDHIFSVCTSKYENGNLAVVLYDENYFPYSTLSINVVSYNPGKYSFVVNHDVSVSLLKELLKSDMFEKTNVHIDYGFVKSAPILRFTNKYHELLDTCFYNK